MMTPASLLKAISNKLDRAQMKQRGEEGEAKLNDWLKENGLSFLYVNQAPEYFAPLFVNSVKRPDFLVLIEAMGLIAVDVKNYKPYVGGGGYTLRYEDEVKRVIAFERLFRIPVWYAYLGNDAGAECWYWISALKAVEVGELREKKEDDGITKYLLIKFEDFCMVKTNDDLGRLYTQRLPKVERLSEPTL